MSRSRPKRRGHQIPLFILKLQEIVENKEIESIISWTTTSDSFHIKNISQFTDQVLPKYFKHRNFSSFIRQLNMYDFHKVRHSDGENIYMNQNFRMSNRALLRNINRKIRPEKEDQIAIYQNPSSFIPPKREIQQLKSNQKNLEELVKQLVNQNKRMQEENQQILKKMEEESQQKDKNLEQLLLFIMMNKNNLKELRNEEEDGQLSLMANEQNLSENDQQGSPLDIMANIIDQNPKMKKFKTILENAYLNKKPKKKETNFTFVNHQPQTTANHHKVQSLANNYNKLERVDPSMPILGEEFNLEKQENSFLSFDDFINAEDYNHDINLEESR